MSSIKGQWFHIQFFSRTSSWVLWNKTMWVIKFKVLLVSAVRICFLISAWFNWTVDFTKRNKRFKLNRSNNKPLLEFLQIFRPPDLTTRTYMNFCLKHIKMPKSLKIRTRWKTIHLFCPVRDQLEIMRRFRQWPWVNKIGSNKSERSSSKF